MSRLNEPPPGTRPKNRRELTIAAATDLFYRRGYDRVTVADVARATNVGSSAVFRHFPTKSQLLLAAIRSDLAPITVILLSSHEKTTPAGQLESMLENLANFALEHRALGVLWQREARNLAGAEQRTVRDEFRRISELLADAVRLNSPTMTSAQADLVSWCILGALVSVGFHLHSLPHDQYAQLLVKISLAVAALQPVEPSEVLMPATSGATSEVSRKVKVLNRATELFAERGFGAVSVVEIGTAAGIAGPSVYNHFESKQELLFAVIERANAVLQTEAIAALAQEDSAQIKLGRLIDSYIGLAIRDRFLVRILLSEIHWLDADDYKHARRAQREYIDIWTNLLVECRSEAPVVARIRVQAALLVIGDAVQTPHLCVQPGFRENLRRIALALLDLPGSSTSGLPDGSVQQLRDRSR